MSGLIHQIENFPKLESQPYSEVDQLHHHTSSIGSWNLEEEEEEEEEENKSPSVALTDHVSTARLVIYFDFITRLSNEIQSVPAVIQQTREDCIKLLKGISNHFNRNKIIPRSTPQQKQEFKDNYQGDDDIISVYDQIDLTMPNELNEKKTIAKDKDCKKDDQNEHIKVDTTVTEKTPVIENKSEVNEMKRKSAVLPMNHQRTKNQKKS